MRRFKRDGLPAATIERLIDIACLSPSVGLSQPGRFVVVDDPKRRRHPRLFRDLQSRCARGAEPEQLYARLKLAGVDDAPCQLGVFADHATAQGGGLGRPTMPETLDYSVTIAIHTLWFAARAEGLGVGWSRLWILRASRKS